MARRLNKKNKRRRKQKADVYGAKKNKFLKQSITLSEVPESVANLKRKLHALDLERAVATISGILTVPDLAANAYRLEKLLFHVLTDSRGNKHIDRSDLAWMFTQLGACGYALQEDPTEDLFITLAMYRRKNFRIFEGLWEGNGFYLQRFLDILEAMPDSNVYETLRLQVANILIISDEVANRRQLERYLEGAEIPQKKIPRDVLNNLSELSKSVVFSFEELAVLGIGVESLAPFCCSLSDWRSADESFLQHKPLLVTKNGIIVLACSYISVAIRNHVIDFAVREKQTEALRTGLSRAYSLLFRDLPLLGREIGASVRWDDIGTSLVSQLTIEVDPGRHLHLVFLLDDFSDPEGVRLEGLSSVLKACDGIVETCVFQAISNAKKQRSLREGISIVVSCGWGRGFVTSLPRPSEENWRIISINAYHLTTLSMTHDMSPLDIFRLEDHVSELERRNVRIMNIGGFLNLYGYAKQLDHNLLPHNRLSTDPEARSTQITLMVPDTFLLVPRIEATQDQDLHLAMQPDGTAVVVQRFTPQSYFDRRRHKPLYGSRDDVLRGRLKAVFESEKLDVWFTASINSNPEHEELFTLWEAFINWLPMLVPAIVEQLPDQRIASQQWHINFPEYDDTASSIPNLETSPESLAAIIALNTNKNTQTVHLDLPRSVLDALHQPANHAEVAVLQRLSEGTGVLADTEIDISRVISQTVASVGARNLHVFLSRFFTDYVKKSLPNEPVYLSDFDYTFCRIGMANRADSYSGESEINGIQACCRLLNEVVESYWHDIRVTLHSLDRQAFVKALLENIECIRSISMHWERTTRAILELKGDTEQTRQSITQQMTKRSSSSLASRNLMEMAICECPTEGGAIPGQLDMSRLMASVYLMVELGGWSDAIKYEVMDAKLEVTSHGHIRVDPEFFDQVIQPYGKDFASRNIALKSEDYDSLFEESKPTTSVAKFFDPDFLSAWAIEFGFSLDDGICFLDKLEDYAISNKRAVIFMRYSELYSLDRSLDGQIRKKIIETLLFHSRNGWDSLPNGMSYNDIVPWRFRRRLSSVRRPILQITSDDDPLVLIAPAFVREGFNYLVDRSKSAEFDGSHYTTSRMKSWIGRRRDEFGHQFNIEVADRLHGLGWNTQAEVKINEILKLKLERDYGDIDVLAWRPDSGRVLVIECKDLMFAKTPGEVAKQLHEFRGQLDEQGGPDRLRKHLMRINVLTKYLENLRQELGIVKSRLEGVLVFRNPVPVTYSRAVALSRVRITLFEELCDL